jgi:hypothetical protein
MTRRQRVAVGLWAVVAVVVWNGVYDMTVTRGVKEYLFRTALHEAGRGPRMSMAAVMDVAVHDAVWIATLWTSVILLAGLCTIRLVARTPGA